MPIVTVSRDDLFTAVGKHFSEDEFRDLCFAFGVELDDVTSEMEQVRKERGDQAAQGLSEEILYKIEIPANRYDLLCIEGISRAFRIFLGIDKALPDYTVVTPNNTEVLVVKPETAEIRPFCVSAILRGISFDEKRYDSFIKLQDKLHANICRERTLVAIGTHDYDTIQGPFTYEALPPNEISFVPLKEEKEFTAETLMPYYEHEKQTPLKKYLHIIKDAPRYPVIYDANRVVLSLPPIINGEHSKITLNTKNVFIECTATDRTKANIVLNILVCMFSEFCTEPFTTEAVNVVYEATGESEILPNLSQHDVSASLTKLTRNIGVNDISIPKAQEMLMRMQLPCEVKEVGDDAIVNVQVGPTRPDILHPCDIEEDLAIAYGFNNIEKTFPKCSTIGKQQPLNKLSDLLRHSIAELGFLEVLTWALISKQDNFHRMNQPEIPCVELEGTRKLAEFEAVRTSLIPCLLKTLGHNRGHVSLPVRIFEVSDVCLLTDETETGAKNERRLSVLYCGRTSGFEIIHGVLDRLMLLLDVTFKLEEEKEGFAKTYDIAALDDPSFFPGMSARILYDNVEVGKMGVVHPEVLRNFSIEAPTSVLEINIEPFL